MSLSSLIAGRAHHEEIASYLDRLSAARRKDESLSLSRQQQRLLFGLVSSAPPITLEHFVPESVGERTEVIHYGRNTIPVPAPLQRFEKRFSSPPGEKGRLFGYNEGITRRFIGPGYFVAEPTDYQPAWRDFGAVVVDYFQVPNGPVPTDWPKVVSNRQGLQRFVFDQTRDFMRKVSAHVSIGSAFRGDEELGFWFVLCRDDAGVSF
jgi:hypothetical protein